jgi:hypothetical protein
MAKRLVVSSSSFLLSAERPALKIAIPRYSFAFLGAIQLELGEQGCVLPFCQIGPVQLLPNPPSSSDL